MPKQAPMLLKESNLFYQEELCWSGWVD